MIAQCDIESQSCLQLKKVSYVDVNSIDVGLQGGRHGEGFVALVAGPTFLARVHRVHVLPLARPATEKAT